MMWIKKQFATVIAIIAIVMVCLNAPVYCTDDLNQPRNHQLEAVALAASVTGTILSNKVVGEGVLSSGGCYVWQQPGVALAITSVWQTDDAVALYFDPGRLHGFLVALPKLSHDEPFLHPPEPGDSDEYYIEPQVYMLNSEQSRSRLSKYMEGYEMWMGFNEGAEFIEPDDESLLTGFAVVYINSNGPLEFHFRVDECGRLTLQHLFLWEYFSA